MFDFLVDTYATERLKVLTMWAMFADEDVRTRPHADDPRGRNLLEHMIHQCVGEDGWFVHMLGIDVNAPPLPDEETRAAFAARYAADSAAREEALRGERDEAWWLEEVKFFEVQRSRAWVLTRRIAHTAHHRGQQSALLRVLGRDLHSTYGPTADTGGLPTNGASIIYPFNDVARLAEGLHTASADNPLPAQPDQPVTERP